MTKIDITQNIDFLIGDDITKDVCDIKIGEPIRAKKTLNVPENIKTSLDSQDSSVPHITSDEIDEDLGRIFEDLDENKKDRKFENKQIFEDAKKEEKEEDSSKKVPLEDKGVGFKETATRRIDLDKVLESDSKKNNLQKTSNSLEPKNIANGIKIPAKIRSAMDMDDEEEENGKSVVIFNPNDLNNQLHNYITVQEKNILQDKDINQNNQLQGAEKLGAIHKAGKDIKDLGLKMDNKEAGKTMLGSVNINENKEKIVKKVIEKKLKIKTKTVKPKETKKLVEGIKKIKNFGGEVKGIKATDAIKAGDKNAKDKDVAKIIYDNAKVKDQEKTAKKLAKNMPKDDIQKIVEKTGRGSDEKSKNISDKEKTELVKKELDNKNSNERIGENLGKQMVKEKGGR